ncbi:RNA demethylase ALKBH10B-like [Lolium rigidum]|uniref:RNA demethylase ALKBH10B-like n=1 Tax=Lolium rigidum TaxID=89674 RepID=UPI001F5CAA7A|nr:RNA demethylase ALKBH10B-like [Lolium rigidum]
MVAGAPLDHNHHPHPHQQPAWLMDERDGFISWLRGEFAAANAIIDLLVLHLRALPGDYDHVFAAVHQRRHHWAHIIHMQQFFPVTDVALALQHTEWLRRAQTQQPHPPTPQALQQQHAPNPPPPPARRHNSSYAPSHNHRNANGRADPPRPAANVAAAGSDKHGRELHNQEGKGLKEGENVVDAKSLQLDSPITDEGEKNPKLQTDSEGSSKVAPAPSEYTTREIIDGRPVNTVEGLKVYEGLVNVIEINKIVSLANETKASSRRGGLEAGQTVIVGRRPLRGHGSAVIQLGVPIIEGPFEDENQRETRVDAVPGLLQDLFDRFFQQGIIPSKPDYCVIDFFNEGEYSHPQQPPPWYGRPLCTLCLTECDMVFGRVILGERGDNRGPLKLSLSTGSLLVLQGRSADVAKRSIPATHKQRILLTFGKSVPRKLVSSESAARVTPTLAPPPMPWGPPSRPANMRPHSPSPKHFGYAPTSSVLPAPMAGPLHIPPSDGMQPLFVAPAPVAAAAIPFPAAVQLQNTAPAWIPEAAPRSAPPRLPVPGTGVFLPPGSGHQLLPPHQMIQASHAHAEMANGNASPRSTATSKRPDTVEAKPECNGSSNGGCGLVDEKSAVHKEQQQNGGMKKAGNSKAEPGALAK